MPRGTHDVSSFGCSDPFSGLQEWPRNPLRKLSLYVSGAAYRAACNATRFGRDCLLDAGAGVSAGDTEEAFSRWIEQCGWPVRPFRIGVSDPGAWQLSLINAPGLPCVEWVMVDRGTSFENAPELLGLDACVRRPYEGGLCVLTNEHPGKDASWHDWSVERPTSYIAVFPPSIDCSRVTIAPHDGASDPRLERAVIEAAAVLSRASSRLTLADRTLGRLPIVANQSHAVMAHLRDAMSQSEDGSHAAKSAARAVGAYFGSFVAGVPEQECLPALEAAAERTGDEPHTVLRLGAVRLGAGHDESGLDALMRADRMLRGIEMLPGVDTSAFIQAELDFGGDDSRTLGRIAAGVVLACANLSTENVRHFRDDLLDDAQFSGWLVGRDQDRSLLHRFFNSLERSHRAEVLSLPSASIAPTRKKRAAKKKTGRSGVLKRIVREKAKASASKKKSRKAA